MFAIFIPCVKIVELGRISAGLPCSRLDVEIRCRLTRQLRVLSFWRTSQWVGQKVLSKPTYRFYCHLFRSVISNCSQAWGPVWGLRPTWTPLPGFTPFGTSVRSLTFPTELSKPWCHYIDFKNAKNKKVWAPFLLAPRPRLVPGTEVDPEKGTVF